MSNELTNLAKEILEVEADLSCRSGQIHINNFSFHVFEQLWGSTALGFGGFGGSAMTSAYTVVCVPTRSKSEKCFVYFAGKYAYCVPFSEVFLNDIRCYNMESVEGSFKYIEAASKEGNDGH